MLLQGQPGFTCVVFTHDKSSLIAGHNSGTICLWKSAVPSFNASDIAPWKETWRDRIRHAEGLVATALDMRTRPVKSNSNDDTRQRTEAARLSARLELPLVDLIRDASVHCDFEWSALVVVGRRRFVFGVSVADATGVRGRWPQGRRIVPADPSRRSHRLLWFARPHHQGTPNRTASY